MAGKMINKVMGFLGLEDEMDEEVEEVKEDPEDNDVELFSGNNKSSNVQSKVVSIHTSSTAKVLIVKPDSYEQAMVICDDIKNRKIAVINITEMEQRTAQRFLDFMGGATYAIGGDIQEVEKGVYIISPSNVEVTNELKSELTGKGLFDWSK
jgi:cell division inhibitor SepF